MGFGVFMHRSDSIYQDVLSSQYQFPKQYLGRAQACVGHWIVYLEPKGVAQTRGYFTIARVQEIIPDPSHSEMYLAIIEKGSYLDFSQPVQFRHNGEVLEQGLLNNEGKISGRAQSAVRPISDEDFCAIVDHGLTDDHETLPRQDDAFHEDPDQDAFITPRMRVDQLTKRPVRDRNFRNLILKAYDKRCAITGMCLINGGGRAEVEAAHIRPVEHDGPDSINNGMALTGTAHWMFDRGLIGINDNFEIMISRQVNDLETIHAMINQTGALLTPKHPRDYPNLAFIRWHQEYCFKG